MTDFVQPGPRSNLLWAAVDLDGTLAEPVWTPDNPTSEIGKPIWANVYKARRLEAAGYKVAIHTSRPWTDYEAIEAWCRHWIVPCRRIVAGKILAAIYIDDRARHADAPSWDPQDPADGRIGTQSFEKQFHDLLLDRMGFVLGAETSADGSASNDLAEARARAALALLELVRAHSYPEALLEKVKADAVVAFNPAAERPCSSQYGGIGCEGQRGHAGRHRCDAEGEEWADEDAD